MKKICYWCGNTNKTWYNTGKDGDGYWGFCDEHEDRCGELSIYAEKALTKFPVVSISWVEENL